MRMLILLIITFGISPHLMVDRANYTQSSRGVCKSSSRFTANCNKLAFGSVEQKFSRRGAGAKPPNSTGDVKIDSVTNKDKIAKFERKTFMCMTMDYPKIRRCIRPELFTLKPLVLLRHSEECSSALVMRMLILL